MKAKRKRKAKMKVLLDVNILLDSFLKRPPFFAEALAILQAHKAGRFAGYVAASTLPNIAYIGQSLRRRAGLDPKQAVQNAIADVRFCVAGLYVVWLDEQVMQTALAQPGNDLEDDLQVAAVLVGGLDVIVTRDIDFRRANIKMLTPTQLLRQI
jgi:predicted nucleic acid-binding protein